MDSQSQVLIQPKIGNVLITKSPIPAEFNAPPKGSITLVLRQLKGSILFSSDHPDISLPIEVKVHVHSLNLLDIQTALQNNQVQGLTTHICLGRYSGQIEFSKMASYFKDVTILELIATAQTIKWVHNNTLLQNIDNTELKDGDVLDFGLVLDNGTGGLSSGFNY